MQGVPTLLRHAGKTSRLVGAVVAVALQVGWHELHAQSLPRILDGVQVELTAVEDSSAYLLYQYSVVNPASSRGGVAGLELDLSAPRGTGHVTLAFTGALGPSRPDAPDHVPFGAIAPDRWKVLVDWKARLLWYTYEIMLAEGTAPVSFDSVASGAARSGFGVRSPYLPGVREFAAIPTVQSCCTKANAQGELPSSFLFKVRGFTVAPTYAPEKIKVQVLGKLLRRACGELGWIEHGRACESLRAKLAPASEAEQRGDHKGATGALRAFVAELVAQHGPGKPVNDNAYWLLKANGEYLLAHM